MSFRARRFLMISLLVGVPITLLIWFVFIRPPMTIVPDDRKPFVLDAGKPFVFELGRGSGWAGLEIIEVRETGAVRLQRPYTSVGDESTNLQLTPAQLAELVALINQQNLTALGKSYAPIPTVNDGTQWVLWIKQGAAEKAVFFDNAFPGPIKTVAGSLDAMLNTDGLGGAKWTVVPFTAGEQFEKALWSRIN